MKIFKSIREFFWPLLEKGNQDAPKNSDVSEINVDEEHLEKALGFIIKQYESEDDRKKTVESKSSLFIGTISVVTSVIIGITSVLVKENSFNVSILVLVFLLFILTLYMVRTIWFSIEALTRRNYHSISAKDFLISDAGNEYYKTIIAKITNKIRKNAITINSKVDSMTMAQEYFKRAIVVVAIYSFVILIFFFSKSNIEIDFHFKKVIGLINGVNLNGWNTVILYSFVMVTFFLSLRANFKLRRKAKKIQE